MVEGVGNSAVSRAWLLVLGKHHLLIWRFEIIVHLPGSSCLALSQVLFPFWCHFQTTYRRRLIQGG